MERGPGKRNFESRGWRRGSRAGCRCDRLLLSRAVLGWAPIVLVLALFVAGCAKPRAGQIPPPALEVPPPAAEPQPPAASADAAFQRGTAALEAGRYNDAIPDLYTVLEAQPGNLVARYNLGVALFRVRQWKEAVEVLTASRERDLAQRRLGAGVSVPTGVDADYLHALGSAYQERREFDAALACFEAAIAAEPKHLKSRYARAITLETRGDLTQARTAWRDYIHRDPKSTWGESARKHLAQVESRLVGSKSP